MLDRLSRKFKNAGIPHLIIPILACHVLGYILSLIPSLNFILEFLKMDPYLITRGQIWRLVTWIIAPQYIGSPISIILAAIMVFIYFQIGTLLEMQLGKFKFNVFILGGIAITDIGVMLLYGLFCLHAGTQFGFANLNDIAYMNISYSAAYGVDTQYIFMSLFLAMSAMAPDSYVRLWFIIPLKMKYMFIVYIVFIGFDAVQIVPKILSAYQVERNTMFLYWIISYFAVIAFSVINYLLFLASLGQFGTRPSKRMREFQKAMNTEEPPHMRRESKPVVDAVTYRYKCAVCGRKDTDFPNLEFRYCSKCAGSRVYCNDHLFTHEHVK